jgi:ribose-phosphate pyrophosphokinase
MMDDMIDTAGTITNGANALVKLGAKDVFACCSHGVLSGPAIQRINDSVIKELIILNTIDVPESKHSDKITTLSVAPIMAEAIRRIYEDVSVSKLFEDV